MSKGIKYEYIKSKIKRYPFIWIKEILFLIPIFCIVSMFSTAMSVNKFNQILFLKNCSFDNIVVTEKETIQFNEFKYIEDAISATEKLAINKKNIYKNKRVISVFIVDKKNKYSFDNTFFNKNNFVKGNINKIINSEDITAAIDFKTAKELKLKTGDIVTIMLGKNYYELECKVVAILFPMNDFKNDATGVCLLSGKKIKDILEKQNVEYKYVSFVRGEFNSRYGSDASMVINRDDWFNRIRSLISFKNRITINVLFPLMGLILIFLIVNREVSFIFKREQKNIAILRMLGTNLQDIVNIFIVEQIIIITVSSLIATIIYKFVLFEIFIKEYITFINFIAIFLGCILLGLICVFLNSTELRKKLNNFSVIEVLTTREL